HGLAAFHDQIEELSGGIDDDGAGFFTGIVTDDLAVVLPVHLLDRNPRQIVARVGGGAVAAGEHRGCPDGAAAGKRCRERKGGKYRSDPHRKDCPLLVILMEADSASPLY